MGQQYSSIPPEHLRPQGLYANHTLSTDLKQLRKRILDGRLAPCEAGCADNTDAHELEECPICFLFYRALNRATCCGKALCTECFLQVECLCGVPCQCPFCKAGDMAVTFSGPRTAAERRTAHQEEQMLIEARLQARRNEEASSEQRRAERIAEAAAAAAAGGPSEGAGFESQASGGSSTPPLQSWSSELATPADQKISPFSYSSSPYEVSSPRSPASSAGRERTAERQARFMSEEEARFVPKDLLSNFGSASMDLDLNDLMLMQALHLSMREDSPPGKGASASELADSSEGSGGSSSSRVSAAASRSGGSAADQATPQPKAAAEVPTATSKAAAGQAPALLADAIARRPPPPAGRHDVFIGMVLTRFAPLPQYRLGALPPPQDHAASIGSPPLQGQSASAADGRTAAEANENRADLSQSGQGHDGHGGGPGKAANSGHELSTACEASRVGRAATSDHQVDAASKASSTGASDPEGGPGIAGAGAGGRSSAEEVAGAAGSAETDMQEKMREFPPTEAGSGGPRAALLRFEPDEAVLLENPDGSRRFVLLRDDRLDRKEAAASADAERDLHEGEPVLDAMDAALLATIARGDAAVRAVYERRVRSREEGMLGAAPGHAVALSSGEQASSSVEALGEDEGWLQQMRAADAALTAALDQGDTEIVQRIGRSVA